MSFARFLRQENLLERQAWCRVVWKTGTKIFCRNSYTISRLDHCSRQIRWFYNLKMEAAGILETKVLLYQMDRQRDRCIFAISRLHNLSTLNSSPTNYRLALWPNRYVTSWQYFTRNSKMLVYLRSLFTPNSKWLCTIGFAVTAIKTKANTHLLQPIFSCCTQLTNYLRRTESFSRSLQFLSYPLPCS